MSSTMIEIAGLSRRFGNVHALQGIDIELPAGAPIGLVGPNGAGKTTLLSILCGFLRPSSGIVRLFGHPPLDKALHGRVAILPQDAALVKGVPIGIQLQFFAELQGYSRRNARAQAEQALSEVGLSNSGAKPPETFSHGMLKRVAIAQAFIGEPDLILLDEPTAGLDPATASRLRDLIRPTAEHSNFIISSHNLDDIEDLCESVLILDGGRLSQYKPLAELVGRSTCLTFRLEQAPPAGVEAIFAALPDVTRVETSETGGHYLLVHYRESAGDAAQLQILQTLQQAGLRFLDMSRGQPLERRVMDIVK